MVTAYKKDVMITIAKMAAKVSGWMTVSQIPAPRSNTSSRVWAWVIRLPGGTPWTSQTFPPITEPCPIVTRPRIVAPE
jgi:hypothetical protein